MIIGIGTDLCDIRRIEKTLKRFGRRFVERLFVETEQAMMRAAPEVIVVADSTTPTIATNAAKMAQRERIAAPTASRLTRWGIQNGLVLVRWPWR